MHGPEIIVRTISARQHPDQHGNRWQYHPRSDHHSKVTCWGILFDLLLECDELRRHVTANSARFGINHEMSDFRTGRRKNLDLVICTPRPVADDESVLFSELVPKYGILLSDLERQRLDSLPPLRTAPVGAVRIALEAKAAMTAHSKAQPRLHDELDSSHSTVHGAVENAIAAGLVMINAGSEFLSPSRNNARIGRSGPEISSHDQPSDAEGIVRKVLQIRRRERIQDVGFDALAAIVVNCRNDGSPVELVQDGFPEVGEGQILNYGSMIRRMSQLYASRFSTH